MDGKLDAGLPWQYVKRKKKNKRKKKLNKKRPDGKTRIRKTIT